MDKMIKSKPGNFTLSIVFYFPISDVYILFIFVLTEIKQIISFAYTDLTTCYHFITPGYKLTLKKTME